ncbi:MAG: hypothetical protein AB1489_00890 [Acidobacteriota bacterium]
MIARPTRLRFEGIERNIDEQSGQYDIAVRLSFDEKIYKGQCQGYVSESNELELVASAALQAVEEFVQQRFQCRLLEFDRVNALGKDLIVLLINIRFDERDLQIFGSCRANNDLLEASARAALDATNRYVELVLANDGPTIDN